jgi:hypothetical protein
MMRKLYTRIQLRLDTDKHTYDFLGIAVQMGTTLKRTMQSNYLCMNIQILAKAKSNYKDRLGLSKARCSLMMVIIQSKNILKAPRNKDLTSLTAPSHRNPGSNHKAKM